MQGGPGTRRLYPGGRRRGADRSVDARRGGLGHTTEGSQSPAHTRDPAILAILRWATLVLILVLIWWNDNPLYGAEPETLSFALALGTLAVPWSSLGADSQSRLGEGRPIRLTRAEGRDLVSYGRTGKT